MTFPNMCLRIDIFAFLFKHHCSLLLDQGNGLSHYDDVIMGMIASQITSLTIVYSTVYLGADQRKHQSSASLAFVRGNSPGTDLLHITKTCPLVMQWSYISLFWETREIRELCEIFFPARKCQGISSFSDYHGKIREFWGKLVYDSKQLMATPIK